MLEGSPFKIDLLTFYRFKNLEDTYWQNYLTLKVEDELILISLANLLNKYVLTQNVFIGQSFAGQTVKLFVAEIRSWSNLRVIFVIDLPIYSSNIRKRLLEKIKPLIEDQFIRNLIENFLHCPVLDKKGINRADERIPPVRFIHDCLLNFYLDDLDRKFVSKFPGLAFARFYNHMLVPIFTACKEEYILFIQKFIIDISGVQLHILKPGDGKVVSFLSGSILLNRYGKVNLDMS